MCIGVTWHFREKMNRDEEAGWQAGPQQSQGGEKLQRCGWRRCNQVYQLASWQLVMKVRGPILPDDCISKTWFSGL